MQLIAKVLRLLGMGRIIGGSVLGLIVMAVTGFILGIVIAFAIGGDGMVDADRNPTMVWSFATLIVGFAVSFIGGIVGRAVGKDKMTTFILVGITVLYSAYAMATVGNAEMPPIDPKTPENIKAIQQAAFDVQKNSPIWMTILGFLVSIGGLALGGLKSGDFGQKADDEDSSEQESTSEQETPSE